MRVNVFTVLLPLLSLGMTACSSPTNIGSGHSTDVTCVDDKDSCAAKASRACPAGYAVVKENPPVGTGIYSTDHSSPTTAQEEMVFSMTVQCK